MKLVSCFLMLTLSSSSFADSLFVGPRFGHQNLKANSKGSESVSIEHSYNETGPITTTPTLEKDNESSQSFSNSTLEGLRLGYELQNLSIATDLDFARYYNSGSNFSIFGLGFSGQYTLLQTSAVKFYSLLGLSLKSVMISLYESKSSYAFNGSSTSIEWNVNRMNIINYDVGLGFGLPVSDKLNLVFETKYSDTINKGTFEFESKTVAHNETDSVNYTSKSKSKNFTITTQEVTIGLLFSL